jgi:alpha-glucosidase
MQWEGSPSGGFSTGTPWLPPIDPAQRNVADQAGDPQSILTLYRDLIAARRALDGPIEVVDDVAAGVIAFTRGAHVVALNLGDTPAPTPPAATRARLVRHTHDAHAEQVPEALPPGHGIVARR